MDIETAKKITNECFRVKMLSMGIGDFELTNLSNYSLSELLEANHMVRDDDGHQVFCDDRLVAGIYALHNYEAAGRGEEIDPIIQVGDKALICIRVTPEMMASDEG